MTYPATPTYWLEPTGEIAWGLRRYSYRNTPGFTCADGYHDALRYVGRAPADSGAAGRRRAYESGTPRDSDLWPKQCERCDYLFTETDVWQDWAQAIYRRPDTGTEYLLHQQAPADNLGLATAPPGASWDATWVTYLQDRNPDGIVLMVRCPNGEDWMVDSEASNCTRKGERHNCWVRHGDPRQANVTVDKSGDTCAAGAGSILAGDYHGFLQGGTLTAG